MWSEEMTNLFQRDLNGLCRTWKRLCNLRNVINHCNQSSWRNVVRSSHKVIDNCTTACSVALCLTNSNTDIRILGILLLCWNLAFRMFRIEHNPLRINENDRNLCSVETKKKCFVLFCLFYAVYIFETTIFQLHHFNPSGFFSSLTWQLFYFYNFKWKDLSFV